MASTNFDMDSDESYHSESEFYYPEEMENYNDKENMNKTSKMLSLQWRVCKSIFYHSDRKTQ